MKKLLALTLAACVLISMTACGKDKKDGVSSPQAEGASTVEDGRETGGYAEGKIGDRMENEFFAYTVLSAEKVMEYEGHAAPEGKELIVAEIKVENVFGETIPMYSSDFQIQWGEEDGEDDWGLPVEKFADDLMEDEYELKKNESITKKVVYEVPAGNTKFSISYLEIYEDEMEGNVYFVYFTLD